MLICRKQYFACPDDKTFRYMASIYSQSHYNMSLSTEFKGGITNGAHWYEKCKLCYLSCLCFSLTLKPVVE